jgi:hypothetical protein
MSHLTELYYFMYLYIRWDTDKLAPSAQGTVVAVDIACSITHCNLIHTLLCMFL